MTGPRRCRGSVGHTQADRVLTKTPYADRVYREACQRYQCSGTEAMLSYCTREDARLQQARAAYFKRNNDLARFNRRASVGGLGRVYGPGMTGLFPVTGAIAHAVGLDDLLDLIQSASEFIKNIVRSARAFMKGMKAGLEEQLSSEDMFRFGQKLAESSIVTVVFPLVFGAGAVKGIVDDVVDGVKGIVDLASNIREIARSAYELIKEMLTNPSMAYELGKEVGGELAQSFKKLLSRNVVRFTFEMGRIVGPFIVYSLLAFFGFPQAALLRVGSWLTRFLTKFPKLAKIVNRIAKLIPGKKGFVLYGKATRGYIRNSGIPKSHFDAFKATAREQKVIVVVRNTNPKSLELIDKHKCPPKAKKLEGIASTKPSNQGIVMAEDVKAVRQRGFAVVDKDLVARDKNGKQIELPNVFWKLEKGQVIDVKAQKPVVGDYDLMGVIDPAAPGRNIALVSSNGDALEDVTSPIVNRFKDAVNGRFDQDRVLHGAQDQYGGFRGGATVIYPDGNATFLPDDAAVKAFYDSPNILRQTRTGKYAQQATRPTFDENGRFENVILGPWSDR